MSACSTHTTLQAGTVQLSDQHNQLGGSYASRPYRNTGLPNDKMTPITHTRRSPNILHGQSLDNSYETPILSSALRDLVSDR